MLRRLFVIVALVALLSPGALVALSPAMDPNGSPAAATITDPRDDAELSPAMDPNGLLAAAPSGRWTASVETLVRSLIG